MKPFLFLTFFLATTFVVSGTHIDFKFCGEEILRPEYIDVSPYPVQSGEEVKIEVPFVSGRFSFPKLCA